MVTEKGPLPGACRCRFALYSWHLGASVTSPPSSSLTAPPPSLRSPPPSPHSPLCQVGLWDTRSGARVALLRGHVGAVRNVSFWYPPGAPDALVTSGDDATVRVWSLDDALKMRQLNYACPYALARS